LTVLAIIEENRDIMVRSECLLERESPMELRFDGLSLAYRSRKYATLTAETKTGHS
jgi:hypothetical protein